MTAPHNPYTPPNSPLEDIPTSANPLNLVSGWLRLVNSLVDGLTLWVLSTLINMTGVFLAGGQGSAALGCGLMLFNLFVNFVFFTCFEYFLGRTPGKFVTGTVVLDENGEKPRFWQIVGRTAARFIPFEVFTFFGKESRGWHDSLSKTVVVSLRGT